jgi:hypothetical protein
MKTIYYILYNLKELRKRNRAPILYYSTNFEEVIDAQENQFPAASLYIYESKIRGPKSEIGKIKCHDRLCDKDVIIINQEIPPAFPFCSPIHQSVHLYDLLEAGKEDKVDDTEYDNIEGENI